MNIFKSYRKGIQEATLRPNMAVVLWMINFFFASVIYFLFSAMLSAAFGKSLLASDLLQKPNMDVLLEFLTSSGTSLGMLVTAGLVLVVLFFLAGIFVNGGILQSLIHRRDDEGFAQVFFAGGGKFYGRFFRLSIYSLIFWIPAVFLYMIISGVLGIFTKNPLNEQGSFYIMLLRIAIALFLIFLIKMIMDYARLRIATQDSRSVLRSLLEAAGFVFRKLVKTLALYYLLGLTGVAAFLIYWGIRSTFSAGTLGTIWLGFIISQIFIASRGWLRIAFQAGQLRFFTLESF
jgi:MFS family permease